jgi:PAS domain S-box-containing protein
VGEWKSDSSGNERQVAIGDIATNSERLLDAFSQTSAIGFAILDDRLRYQAINNPLASINGIAPKEHLGFTVRELFGEVSRKTAEPSYHRVLQLGETSHFEVKNAVLPRRAGSRYWALNTNFPILDHAGRIQQIGVVVLEVTQQRKLQVFLHKLAGELRRKRTREAFWFAAELQDSVDQYHKALAVSLEHLARCTADDELSESIVMLDQRIITMGKLVSEVARHFPIVQ